MDAILDRLVRSARRCERAARSILEGEIDDACGRVIRAANRIGESASGSWIGNHAHIYHLHFTRPAPGHHFDSQWGEVTGGQWAEYSREAVFAAIAEEAGVSDITTEAMGFDNEAARATFDSARNDVLPILDVLLSTESDLALQEHRQKIADLKCYCSMEEFLRVEVPKWFQTNDHFAYHQGIWTPPHIAAKCQMMSILSWGRSLDSLAKHIRYIVTYLELKREMKGKSAAKTDGKIFIGHGRSAAWRDLKDFLHDKLGLEYEEFNRESAAGLATVQRLEDMLDASCFAFLVMTAEDELADGSLRARENVVHEVGLFQGRFGFRRAIVVLEEGCGEFSNIHGLGQIRFPKGNLLAKTEEIRSVLSREKII